MLYDSLHEKLLTLPDDVLVYPAHGAGSLCGKNLSIGMLVSEMLVELGSDLDLYGVYSDGFVVSVDLLDRYDRFFDHSMLMAYQALGVETEEEDQGEDSRRLLATVVARLGDVAASDEVEAARQAVSTRSGGGGI